MRENNCNVNYLTNRYHRRYLLNRKFQTLDLETVTDDNGVLHPVLVSWSTDLPKEDSGFRLRRVKQGSKSNIKYIPKGRNKYNDISTHRQYEGEYVKTLAKGLMQDSNDFLVEWLYYYILLRANHGVTYFSHNGGRFDHIYILKALTVLIKDPHQNIKILKINNSIVSIDVWVSPRVKISFKDSYPLLGRQSLDKVSGFLCKNFQKLKVDIMKLNFTNYREPVFLKYVEMDVLSLKEALRCYQKMIEDSFGVNPLQCYTISELSMVVYRKCFYQAQFKIGNVRNTKIIS